MLKLQVPTTFTIKVAHETKNQCPQIMKRSINPSNCPICDQPNQCANEVSKATGKPQEPCWCFSVEFSPKLLVSVFKWFETDGLIS